MKIEIRGDKVEITSAMKEHIEEKLSKLSRYFENPEDVTVKVVARIKGLEQTIEVTVPTKKYTLRAEESHNDFYSSVDLVLDKLEKQIRKHKAKLKKAKKEVEHSIDDLVFAFHAIEDEVVEHNKIVKRKEIAPKPMDEEEAILQMELLNHDFFVFKNIDEESMSVLYKRKDGEYGIINVR